MTISRVTFICFCERRDYYTNLSHAYIENWQQSVDTDTDPKNVDSYFFTWIRTSDIGSRIVEAVTGHSQSLRLHGII